MARFGRSFPTPRRSSAVFLDAPSGPTAAADSLGALSEATTRSTHESRAATDSLAALSEAATHPSQQFRAATDSLGAFSETAHATTSHAESAPDTLAALSSTAHRGTQHLGRTAPDSFGVLRELANVTVTPANPLPIPGTRTRWTLIDSSANAPFAYSFDVNPNQDSPVYQKNIKYQVVPYPGAAPIIQESSPNPITFSVQGTILSEAQYSNLLYFYEVRHSILCVDDLGRQRKIYITSFQPVRIHNALYPWKHTYTLSGYVLSETLP